MSEQALEAAHVVAQEPSQPVEEAKQVTEEGTTAEETQKPEQAAVEEKPKTPEERVKELEEALERTKKGTQKAIDRQTAARKAIEERYAQLEQQLKTMPSNSVDDSPKESDFNTWEEYENAKVEYKAKKLAEDRMREAKQAEMREIEARKAEATRRDLETKEAKFREVAPDYDKAIQNLGEVAKDLVAAGMDVGAMSNMIMQFDNPPAMFYELAKIDGLIDDIVKLPPMGMMRELVKLEMTLQNKPQTETKEAPKPINTVRTSSHKKDLKSMSGKELLKQFGIS